MNAIGNLFKYLLVDKLVAMLKHVFQGGKQLGTSWIYITLVAAFGNKEALAVPYRQRARAATSIRQALLALVRGNLIFRVNLSTGSFINFIS